MANQILLARTRNVLGVLEFCFGRSEAVFAYFGATFLADLVRWDVTVTEPPLSTALGDSALRAAVEEPLVIRLYTCHSQIGQRWVPLGHCTC